MERITNITPIDEFYNKMSKEELYDEYFKLYQRYDLCLKQFDDLEASLRIVKKTLDKIKPEQVLEILNTQRKEQLELFNEQMRDSEVVIVCKE